MASKYDIIIITLVVVIFSVPTICAAECPEEHKNECQNGGTCLHVTAGTDKLDLYICQCPKTFTGIKCESVTNGCSQSYCKNGGTCTSDTGTMTCQCKAGFTGDTCVQPVTPELPKCSDQTKCQNGGTCYSVAVANTQVCRCTSMWIGSMCETPSPELKNIFAALQKNKAQAVNTKAPTNPTATPTNPTATDLCQSWAGRCKNGGRCIMDNAGLPICSCTTYYTGEICENVVNECECNPCLNGGSCNHDETKPGHTCQCLGNTTGSNCETALATQGLLEDLKETIECASQQIGLSDEAFNETSLAYSLAIDGIKNIEDLTFLKTETLEKHLDDITPISMSKLLAALKTVGGRNECSSNPCQNDGKCADLICSYKCNCTHSYQGLQCREKTPSSTDKKDGKKTLPSTDKKDGEKDTNNATKNNQATKENNPATTNKAFQLIPYTLCIIAIAALAFLGYSYRQKVRSWVCEDKDTKKGSKHIDYKRLKEEGTNTNMEIEIDRSEGSTYIY